VSLLPLRDQPGGVPWPTEAWPEGELDARVDRQVLDALLDRAFSLPEPEDLERTHSIVIIQNGALVAERHADDATPSTAFHSWSMAKSVTQSLIGILVRQGRLDIRQPIPVKEWAEGDPRRQITVDHLLRMVDGLRFREAEHLGGGSVRYWPAEESDVIPMLFGDGKDDVAGFAATLPKVAEPEAQWNYNSGGSNLLARLVADVVSESAEDPATREKAMRSFMQKELFEPLGMQSAAPNFDGAGNFIGSSHCYASSQDFARFGYLYLRDGVWGGTRILPEGWVDYTRSPGARSEGLYGAHFWTIPGSLGIFCCHGMGGQRVLISPALDLVIVRQGKTAPHRVGNVERYCKQLIDVFRPTA
jgi:CubicO group peptidase (beta-lactamase class C family)